ncbi:MAG: PilZ domain-containing protein [Sandaracinaceae bacterium]|nr:PilZ domain-containing protein [Sandaracinaceae bacterium]
MHFEMISSTRRSVRRSVGLSCDVLSPSNGLFREQMLDLSTRGACVTTENAALDHHEGILLSFTPPGMTASIEAVARVARVLPDRGRRDLVGLEFTRLPRSAHRDIERALRGLPPPLPTLRRALELSWVEVSMQWEEELDDQLNLFEATERVMMVDDGAELIEVVAPAAAMRLPVHLRSA